MGHTMRIELTRVGLLVKLANRYTTKGAPKVKVIARLEFKFTFYNSAVQRFNHYTIEDQWVHTFPKGISSESESTSPNSVRVSVKKISW